MGSTGVASYYLYGSKKHADAPAINTFKTAALFQNLNVSRLLFTENGPGTQDFGITGSNRNAGIAMNGSAVIPSNPAALHRLSALQVEMISACYDD